jgi:hypothetical protein
MFLSNFTMFFKKNETVVFPRIYSQLFWTREKP